MQSGEDIHREHVVESRRLSRRKLLLGMGAGVAGLSLAPLLAACGGSSGRPVGGAPAPTTSTSGGSSATTTTGSPASGSPVASSGFQMPQISPGSHTLKLLMWSHFVPAFDTWFNKYAQDWGTKNNVQVTVDHIPTNTIPTRVSAEIAANAGHDLVLYQTGSDLHVFADKMLDVTDLATYLVRHQSGS